MLAGTMFTMLVSMLFSKKKTQSKAEADWSEQMKTFEPMNSPQESSQGFAASSWIYFLETTTIWVKISAQAIV